MDGSSQCPAKGRGARGEHGDEFWLGKERGGCRETLLSKARRRPHRRLVLGRGTSSARTLKRRSVPNAIIRHPRTCPPRSPPPNVRPSLRSAGHGVLAVARVPGPGARRERRFGSGAPGPRSPEKPGAEPRGAAAHSPSPPSSSSHEYQMPVWKFLKRKRSSPVSQL